MEKSDSQHPFGFAAFGRYQRGEMSAAEQHALEKQLLDDPLTAEAYEGFLAMQKNEADPEAVSTSLEDQLAARIGTKQHTMTWAYGAAASILIAAGAFWFGYVSKLSTQQHMETVAADTLELPRLSAADPAPPAVNRAADAPGNHPVISGRTKKQAPKRMQKNPASASQIAAAKEPAPASDLVLNGDKIDKNASPGSVPMQAPAAAFPAAPPTVTIPQRPFSSAKSRPSHDGLPPGERIAANENFRQQSIVVFDETSAVPRTSARQGKSFMDKDPAPVSGWKAYNQFLYESTRKAEKKGIVTITFTVGAGGALSGFYTIGEESLFAEATELIQKGPGWSPALAHGTPASKTVTITLHFEKE